MTKTCAFCGREFDAASSRFIYCSKACRRAHWAAKRRELRADKRPHFERICGVCGARFETQRKDKIYCSHKCYSIRNVQNQQALRDRRGVVRTVVCGFCGKSFETTRGDLRYCSAKCRESKAADLRKERRAAKIAARPPRKVTCASCGREFGTKIHGSVKYCPECRVERERTRHRVWNSAWLAANREAVNARRRARRASVIREFVCEVCGKRFESSRKVRHTCGADACLAEWHRRSVLASYVPRPRFERKVKEVMRAEGLTEADVNAVIAAQDSGDRDRLWRESHHWTPAQRKVAKKRYMALHGISSFTTCGSYGFGGNI